MFSFTQLQINCLTSIEDSINVPDKCWFKYHSSIKIVYSIGTAIKNRNLQTPLDVAIILRKAKMIHRYTHDKKTGVVVMYTLNSVEVPIGRRLGRKDIESVLKWEEIDLSAANVQHIAALFEFAECGKTMGIICDTITDFFLRA